MAQQTAEPGQIERRIEQGKPETPRAEPEIRLLPQKPAAPAVKSFVLSAVIIDGATVFDPATFAPYYEDMLAREITLADVKKILAKITKRYRDAGYVLSRAIAPPQDLAVGVLRIQVIEGYIDDVVYEGKDVPQDMIAPYARRIVADRPLRLKTLERYVLLANDISGISIDPRLRPVDEDKGRYALVLKVTRKRIDGLAFLNNRGTPSVGRLQGWASVGLNGAFGWRDRFQFGVFTIPNQPQELRYFEGIYSQAIGDDGLNYSVLLSQSYEDPGADEELRDVENAASRVLLRAWYPLIRSSKLNLWLNGFFQYQDFRETSFNVTTTADRLRVLRANVSYWQAHFKGTTNVLFEVSQGLDILDATEAGSANLSRSDGHSDFTKFNAWFTRQQGLGGNFGLQVKAAGQWSAQPLLSSEEFGLGGTQFGRAYDFSEISGDKALAGSLELRYGRDLDGKWLRAFQLYTFYDLGSVWNNVPGNGTARDSLSSVGGGVRLTLRGNIRANFELASALTRPVENHDGSSPRAFFNLSASF